MQLDDLPEVEVQADFHCTLDEVWDSSSKVADDVIISSLHGQVKAKDLRTLKPGNLHNHVVVYYIGSFSMGQKKTLCGKHILAKSLFQRRPWENA